MRTNLVIVENGKFIFDTNFAGDPKKDRFGSDERKANLVIPDIDLARELIDDGFNIRLNFTAHACNAKGRYTVYKAFCVFGNHFDAVFRCWRN